MKSTAESEIQHQAHLRAVRIIYQAGMRQITLSFGRFFRQDVAFERVFAFDFARPGQLEPLFSSGNGFYFWHGFNRFKP